MNEQQILANLMKDPAYRQALRNLMISDKDLAKEVRIEEKTLVYVWCAEMVDQNTGIKYYHPVIIPSTTMSMEIDSLMDVGNYTMMYSFNQFESYKHEPIVKMFTSVWGDKYPIRLITIEEELYKRLDATLITLVTSILDEIENCFQHIDHIAKIANTDSNILKVRLIGSVFGNMTTVSACFNQGFEITNSESHDYRIATEDCDEFDYDNEDDDYDW